jgi:hypothetical protein
MRVTVGGGEITEGIGTDSGKGEVLGRCRFGNLGFFECIEFSEIRRELPTSETKIRTKIKTKIKGVGQECPTHTSICRMKKPTSRKGGEKWDTQFR